MTCSKITIDIARLMLAKCISFVKKKTTFNSIKHYCLPLVTKMNKNLDFFCRAPNTIKCCKSV